MVVLDRRRFLKYGATAAAVGAAALGLDFLLRPQSNPTGNTATSSTSSTSLTSSPTLASSTKTQLASLSGRLFFDYNGNGKQEDNEPSVKGAKVQLRNSLGDVVAEAGTDSSGVFKIEDVPVGTYKLFPVADSNFRYMCRSVTEFAAVADGYAISLSEGIMELNIGLMEGFVTLPFSKSIPMSVADYFDHDPSINRMWWNGTRLPGSGGHSPPWTHPEIDFLMPKGTEVRAGLSGRIEGINTNPGEVYWISLFNDKFAYGTTYLHIDKPMVPIGATIERGEIIALSGDTGSLGIPHLAFQLWRHNPDGKDYCIDPYSPVVGVPKGAWIAGTWDWYPSDEDWVSQGYWTRSNDPQYPDSSQ